MSNLKNRILDLCDQYFNEIILEKFIPGKTYIPCTGKVLFADDLKNLVSSSLDMWLTSGRFSIEFEKELAKRMNVSYAKLTTSGSSANLLAFSSLTSWKLGDRKISSGSEVITPAVSFPTTVAPIIQNNCIPVFIDVDLETANITLEGVNEAISKNTSAVMAAHTLGNPFEVEEISNLCKKNNFFLIEDCCDAFGATYNKKNVGTFGDIATLSFYPAHHITMGEGGALLTNKKSFSVLIESYRDWGRDCFCKPAEVNTCGRRFCQQHGELPFGYDHKYTYTHLGYNLKVTDMQAAIGLSQLSKIDKFILKRKQNFDKIKKLFIEEKLDKYFILPTPTKNSDPSWFGFLLIIRDKNILDRVKVVSWLEEKKIGTRLLFGGNLTKQPAFMKSKFKKIGDLKNSDKLMNDSFWIGVWPGIDDDRINYIVEVFKEMVKKLSA
jgi:CDP-6-deoxy-D-xylo-4-hexulose-3-dehydrase